MRTQPGDIVVAKCLIYKVDCILLRHFERKTWLKDYDYQCINSGKGDCHAGYYCYKIYQKIERILWRGPDDYFKIEVEVR